MSIWFDKNINIEKLKKLFLKKSLGEYLGMELVDIGDDYLKIKMPVDEKTKQPFGLLHGGASCALAETIGSVASQLVIDNSLFNCVGLQLTANHIRSVKDGFVTAKCVPIHIGKSTHVWDINIVDDSNKLICTSRLTVAILVKPN